jgi:P-type Ca2+ transporter type 2C
MPAALDESAPRGLTSAQARDRLARHGPNALPEAPPQSLWGRSLRQLRDPMILLLLAAGTLTAILGDLADTAIITVVVVMNTVIGVVQERRAERAIAALRTLTPSSVRVLRDGTETVMDTVDVVPGDMVHLAAGDVVPADCRALETHTLQVDESATTGESVPVDMSADGELTGGTMVTRGRAVAEVVATGADSGLGRIAALVGSAQQRPTPLQRRLSRLSAELVALVGVLVAVVLLIGLAQGRPLMDMVITAVSLAVAAVPESLPAVVSVALALGAHRMARRHAVVRRLPAVETLGSVTVLASDKTGTLTEGRMFAERLWTPAGGYVATGQGYDPRGELLPDQVDDDRLASAVGAEGAATALSRALRDAALCSDATLVPPAEAGGWQASGDPMDAALLVLSGKGGVDPDGVRRRWGRRAEQPFEEQRRMMTTLHTSGSTWLLVCKGAPEAVFERLAAGDVGIEAARRAADQLTRQGYRVLAVADRASRTPLGLEDCGLELVALVGVNDPPRETACEVVDGCRRAGIRMLLITGDHHDTAQAIGHRLGIDAEDIYARRRPEDKLRILDELQGNGEVVAMTGDGVNDAPALKGADIGVAMGGTGTEVARQASDLVLADDDLRTVTSAVEEGRRIYANIRSFLRYGISGGMAEVVVMLVGPFLGMPVPLLPGQILWINLLTHGLPGVAFGGEPANPDAMHRPPVPARESVLGQGLLREIGLVGTAITLAALTAGLAVGVGPAEHRTAVFLTLGLAQLGVALALRSRVRPRPLTHRGMELAVLLAAGLQLAAVYLPPLAGLLRTSPLSAVELGIVVAVAAVPGLLVRTAGTWRRARRSQSSASLRDATAGARPPARAGSTGGPSS